MYIIEKALNYFIHPENKQDSYLHTRAKILITIVLFFLLFLLFYNLFFFYQGELTTYKAYLNYSGFLFILSILFASKYSKNRKLPLQLLAGVGYFFITFGIIFAGGIHSNDLYWYVVLIISNILFVGKIEAIIISIFSIFSLFGLYFAQVFLGVELSSADASSSIHYKFFNVIVITAIITILALLLIKGNLKLEKVRAILHEAAIRNELALDFHDQIGNKLASLLNLSKYLATNLEGDLRHQALQQIEKYSGEIYEDFRDFLWTQKSENNYFNELMDYLKDYIEDYLKLSPINFYTKRTPLILTDYKLNFNNSRDILAIFKEALTNAYKHAKASKFVFEVLETQEFFEITLIDDGIGYDPLTVSKGNGLHNIVKRADRIKGAKIYLMSDVNGSAVKLLLNKKYLG